MQRKTVGILFIVVPIPLLMFVLAAYAIMSFIIASVVPAGESGGASVLIGSLMSIILGLFGIVAVIGIIIGLPLGIYLIVTGDKHHVAATPPAAPLPPAQE